MLKQTPVGLMAVQRKDKMAESVWTETRKEDRRME